MKDIKIGKVGRDANMTQSEGPEKEPKNEMGWIEIVAEAIKKFLKL